MGISLEINCERFDFSEEEVKDFLKYITDNSLRGKEKANKILDKLNNDLVLTREDLRSLTEMFFLFNEKVREEMIKRKVWFKIGNICEAERNKDRLEKKAKFYGSYRYEKDYGWLGVYAEEKTKEFFRKKCISFKEWETENKKVKSEQWIDNVDEYDMKISSSTVDIKCATQPHYIEITPKVEVEKEVPKDIYIATKFFIDKNLYLIGFFYHKDIKKYPINQLYGAKYYQVKLYKARCLKELELWNSKST